ncbi:MAG: hypothetical protein GF329_11995 [Candidatus Lokiarchaeota archaeon]|nr:hypothetical protein [Candidatus Lokiarchaeota archaeon]
MVLRKLIKDRIVLKEAILICLLTLLIFNFSIYGFLIEFNGNGSNGGANLTLKSRSSSSIIINEVCVDPDYLELINRGPDKDMTGWSLWLYRDGYEGSAYIYDFPNGFIFPSDSIISILEDSGSDNSTTLFTGFNIFWVGDSPNLAALVDNTDVSVDHIQWNGWTGSTPSGTSWSGILDTAGAVIYYRHGNIDTDSASDWTASTSGTLGSLNPGQSFGSIGIVGILNSTSSDEPSYFTGGWNNNYLDLYNGFQSEGIDTEILSNNDILNDALVNISVLVLIDNVPSSTASTVVKDWALNGGSIVSFDSSICFINWAGILPPEAQGNDGKDTYWDYESPETGVVVNSVHPVMTGYSNAQTIYGSSNDAQYFSDVISGTAAGPYYTSLVKTYSGSNYDLVAALDASYAGRVVQLWDANHWEETSNHQLILNSIYWTSYGNITYSPPNTGSNILINEIFTGNPDWIELINIGEAQDMAGWSIYFWDGSVQSIYNFSSFTLNKNSFVQIMEGYGTDDNDDLYTEFSLTWGTASDGALTLVDESGNVIDHVEFNGWTETPLPGSQWTGYFSATSSDDKYRNSLTDTDSSNDWSSGSSPTPKDYNRGQTPPINFDSTGILLSIVIVAALIGMILIFIKNSYDNLK